MDITDAKILVADDMRTILYMEEGLFKSLGFNPVIAENGTKALEILTSQKIDVAFIDYFMPDMNGDEVMNKYRSMKDAYDTAFVAVSGNTESFDPSGFDVVLSKPIGATDIIIAIRNVLSAKLH